MSLKLSVSSRIPLCDCLLPQRYYSLSHSVLFIRWRFSQLASKSADWRTKSRWRWLTTALTLPSALARLIFTLIQVFFPLLMFRRLPAYLRPLLPTSQGQMASLRIRRHRKAWAEDSWTFSRDKEKLLSNLLCSWLRSWRIPPVLLQHSTMSPTPKMTLTYLVTTKEAILVVRLVNCSNPRISMVCWVPIHTRSSSLLSSCTTNTRSATRLPERWPRWGRRRQPEWLEQLSQGLARFSVMRTRTPWVHYSDTLLGSWSVWYIIMNVMIRCERYFRPSTLQVNNVHIDLSTSNSILCAVLSLARDPVHDSCSSWTAWHIDVKVT